MLIVLERDWPEARLRRAKVDFLKRSIENLKGNEEFNLGTSTVTLNFYIQDASD